MEVNFIYYIQFPFGLVDYKGLKEFQAYHEKDYERHVTTEEVEWFKKCRHILSTDKPILNSMLQTIESYFKEMVWTGLIPEKGKQLRNLVGGRWTTDSEIIAIFDLLNKQHSDVLRPVHNMSQGLALRCVATRCVIFWICEHSAVVAARRNASHRKQTRE